VSQTPSVGSAEILVLSEKKEKFTAQKLWGRLGKISNILHFHIS
jgi:hypothetical protein